MNICHQSIILYMNRVIIHRRLEMKTSEEIIAEKGVKILSVTSDTSIYDALKLMVLHKVGATVIKDQDKIIGIWTERDLMRNTLESGFDSKKEKVGDYMEMELQSTSHKDSVYQLMDKFLGLRIRHLLIEKDGEYIGLLSIGDVIKAALQEKSEELKGLNSMVGLEYYDEWKWDKAKANEVPKVKKEINDFGAYS